MYRKDLITAEIEKLAQVLARIIGLKVELKLEEAKILFDETMLNSFSLLPETIYHKDYTLFEKYLTEVDLPTEKLDSLGEFLYYQLGETEQMNRTIAPKLNLIYEHLSNHHKIVHLVNMHRQKTIQQYL